jgi:hypothetical protein
MERNIQMKNKDFTVFILTHGRPDNVITLRTLRNQGYTGKIYFIIDNEDKTAEKYYENFGRENVIMFDKKKYADQVDEGNNFDERRTITHARNACFDIARNLGITYFIELDDDYTNFFYKFIEENKLRSIEIKDLDYIFNLYLNFYKSTTFKSIAFAQNGEFIGGVTSGLITNEWGLRRKCMNSFICSTDREFQFVGAMNEDVNTYTTLASRGSLFGTIPFVSLNQKQTQSQSGGITDMYLLYGTYCKAFTTVMMMPSSVKVSRMGNKNMRLHHSIKWNNTVPKILSESVRKTVTKQ